MIDLIIPTIPGREASLERCVSSYVKHADVNPIIVHDSKTCGWGWRQGIAASRAPYVLLACDDQECLSGLETAIEAVDEGFIPCPRVYTPDGRIESQGGDMNAFAHLISRPQKDRTPVDYTVCPFLSREQAKQIGMLDVHYSSDVWVSYRGRQLGYETILRHGYDVAHHQAMVGRGAGMGQNERDRIDEITMREELEKMEVAA